ncbi:glycoside hydrolase family 5 protein [Neolentinus lepideus HHB14362 ss-1]|uniref:Glycoside hydrolase family 5 protein n=1 Tax=Neolentinus lepideus HHB14362 ss-1 TaxID=1314782 RepID=A0A165SWJ1_9AGAM|nr:glycoside hydrolase family 5 protein [Neolentinus lepideus HHB14362 ss-1]
MVAASREQRAGICVSINASVKLLAEKYKESRASVLISTSEITGNIQLFVMKLTHTALSQLPTVLPATQAINSWTGANNYYVHTLPTNEQEELFQGMSDAGMKVLCTWVTGQSSGQRNSDNKDVNELEHAGLGKYDDTVLDLLDQTMLIAHNYGVKLLIGMYSGKSPYLELITRGWLLHQSDYPRGFNNRITHILNTHKHKTLGKPWSELGEYIFGFEAQNEPMIFDQNFYHSHLNWICDTAKQIRGNVGNKDILIFTGGSSGKASVQLTFFSSDCAIDVVAIHDYNDDFDSFMPSAVSQAMAADKKLIVEEWGSLFSSSDSSRQANLQGNVEKINKYGVPWLYCMICSQDQNYEIEVNGADWQALKSHAQSTSGVTGAFDFSAALAT